MRGDKAFRRAFGRALKSKREAAGLTQRELAEAVDLAEKYVARIEIGDATPSLPVAVKLARALGAGLDDLTGVEARPDPPEIVQAVKLLRARTPAERDLALRLLRELFREK